MEKFSHTPGPWMVSKGCDQYICAEGKWIAATMGVRGDEGSANATLIAAAPELLEALREAVRVHGDRYSWGPAARAAIAKAMGE